MVRIAFGKLTACRAVMKKKETSGYKIAGKDKSKSGVQGVSER